MIDLEEILEHVKAYYKIVITVLVVIVLALAFWLLRGYGGNTGVGTTITDIQTNMKTNERRADAIIDAAKQREETARNETNQKMAAVSDDDLPDLLAGLLSDWRRDHPGR